MLVGVLLLRAAELFHALGGLQEGQADAVEEPSDPPLAGTHVESLCFEPFVHQASDRHRAEAQDVAHPHEVLTQPCHVGSVALQRSGSPGAPVKTTLRKCCVTNIQRAFSQQQWLFFLKKKRIKTQVQRKAAKKPLATRPLVLLFFAFLPP